MRRRVFDVLTSAVGLVLVVVLFVAGALLMWGPASPAPSAQPARRAGNLLPAGVGVRTPQAGTEITPSMIPSVSQYAGQQLLTGAQAEVYANDFIAVHLSEMPYGGVYSKISAASLAESDEHQARGN